MSDPNTLGSLVRRRRLESGYSLGQLASKVGKTAAEVRAWERDAELPEHGILERLSETLELDIDDIRQRVEAAQDAAAEEEEAATEAPAAESSDADSTEDDAASVSDDDEDDEVPSDPEIPVVFPDETPEDTAEAIAELEESGEEDLAGFPVEDPFTPPDPDDAEEAGGSDEQIQELIDAPTEAVPMPVITDTAAAARAQRAAALLEEPQPLPVVEAAPDADPGLLRYLEPLRVLYDPHSRYLYWIRAGLTVIVMLILVVVLFRLLGGLLNAVGELLDTIEPSATDPDDLDALGALARFS
ncbi:MAG: helix-turn-helix transcriptional regulator [Acidimicrobiia bacterium]|nr:helix-turn-helix transcriptional regulator [Acidimicrobiia bacterium]